MLRSRFLWKLYAGYFALILLYTAIVGGLVTRRIERDAVEEIRHSLEVRAVLLQATASRHFDKPVDPAFQRRVSALGEDSATRLTVIRADGLVIADSAENPSEMDNHANRPEILAAGLHATGTATRFSNTLNTRMMYLALPVHTDGRLIGYVRTSLPLSAIDKRLSHFRNVVGLGVTLAAIVSLLIGVLLARHFVRPLVSMTAVADSMAQGDYRERLPATRKDEIGTLARAFNRMADISSERMDTIDTDRNKLSAILAGMVEGVVAVDPDERVVHMNDAAGNLLGALPHESRDKPISEVTRIGELCEVLAATLREKRGAQRNLQLVTPSGDRVIEMHTSVLYDGQGELAGAVVVLHDVSRLHRLETVRRDFVANASHELKTPITAIRGIVETLIDDDKMPPAKLKRFLGKIRNQSLRLSALVGDLLSLSRLESQGEEAQRAPLDLRLDLRDVVLDSTRALMPTGQERGITLETRLPQAPIEVAGDDEALCQAVTNLLDNALKYTPRGGRVWVRLRTEGADAVIEVEDTGIGIEPRDRERIFERFYRVDKARSRELGGTGLGLAIVKHVARTHGGEVSVESVSGSGSTFRISLPVASPAS